MDLSKGTLQHLLEAALTRAELAESRIRELEAQLWVAKDAQLRTYDGLAQKADRADRYEAALRAIVDAFLYLDDSLSELDRITKAEATLEAAREALATYP